ncbi:hypothetical protein J2W28_001042 [Variovorax boronicumulans]|uniref:hypothetical protein n=1 Tax=Variovorax boronicumulans TaxID=436515 RepID=UPI002783CE1E|nr:hypothetical protein [Variovorax boronicumulans]MDP9992014.1 hypothetical protein [Variovorax boronicumulans]MDQ0001909.1 hypothetical protein [Variovorax boronicumulans]
MSKATYRCACCGDPFIARVADRNRGWARFCSKSCKAIKQEQRTGQHHAHQTRRDECAEPTFSNAHQFDNTELQS